MAGKEKAGKEKGKEVHKQLRPAKKAAAKKMEKGSKAVKGKGEKAGKEKEAKEGKKEKKAGKKEKKAGKKEKKAGKKEKKAGKKEKKEVKRITKSKEVKRLARLVGKKKKRLFRGRFGKRSVRRVSKKKWQRWRKPRGIDIYFQKEDGLVPGTGYRTARGIRFVHPSGFREKMVRNLAEIEEIAAQKERVAARIAASVGKKKRQAILEKADQLGIYVLNR